MNAAFIVGCQGARADAGTGNTATAIALVAMLWSLAVCGRPGPTRTGLVGGQECGATRSSPRTGDRPEEPGVTQPRPLDLRRHRHGDGVVDEGELAGIRRH